MSKEHREDLEKAFGIPGVLRFEESAGGLVRAVISTPQVGGAIYLQGAHVTEWTPRGQRPVLFVSSRSLFSPGKAIRGGVPIIFPWFGARVGGLPGPSHGFARVVEWEFEGAELREDGAVAVSLALGPSQATHDFGLGAFRLRFTACFGAVLDMQLEVRNDSTEPLTCEEALHTYFAVADVHRASVLGLEGTTFIDKTDGFQRKQQGSEPVRIAKETDQVYLNTKATCMVQDEVWGRRMVIEKSGSESTVVWNPWIEKTKSMSDMAPDDWREMICVETANAADNTLCVAPGASHTLRAVIRVEFRHRLRER
jgi:glucose-6-phosphate 1-epimerase